MHVIDTNWGKVLPPQFWDAEKKRFHGVIILVNNTTVQALDTPLKENQEVYLVKVMVGG
jgi:sulfur carrier protein ThiS